MILIRTEASPEIGFGRANRILSLASLIKRQKQIHFLINGDKTLTKILKARKIPFSLIKKKQNWGEKGVKAVLFDIQIFEIFDQDMIKWAEEENIPVVAFSQHSQTINSYVKLQILSPQIMMLHPKFRHFHKLQKKYPKKIQKLFISLGGRTEYRLLRKTLDTLVPHLPHLKIALGPYLKNSCKKIFRRLYPGIHFVGETDNLARSLFEADVAFLTPGMVSHEAAAVGTPALYVYENTERESVASFFENQGAGVKLCNIQQIKNYPIGEILNQIPQKKRQSMGEAGKAMVDGRGLFRVIDFLKNEDII